MSYYLLYRIAARKAAGMNEDEYWAQLRNEGFYNIYYEKNLCTSLYYESIWNAIMTKAGWEESSR